MGCRRYLPTPTQCSLVRSELQALPRSSCGPTCPAWRPGAPWRAAPGARRCWAPLPAWPGLRLVGLPLQWAWLCPAARTRRQSWRRQRGGPGPAVSVPAQRLRCAAVGASGLSGSPEAAQGGRMLLGAPGHLVNSCSSATGRHPPRSTCQGDGRLSLAQGRRLLEVQLVGRLLPKTASHCRSSSTTATRL